MRVADKQNSADDKSEFAGLFLNYMTSILAYLTSDTID